MFIDSTNNNIKEIAEEALNNKLYENENWSLCKTLKKIRFSISNLNKYQISLLNIENQNIGICLFSLNDYCTVSTYIKPEFRKKGYGTLLFKHMKKNLSHYRKSKIRLHYGSVESYLFFENLFNQNIIKRNNIIDSDNIFRNAQIIKDVAKNKIPKTAWLLNFDLKNILIKND